MEGRGAASLCPLIRGGILTNGLAAPVITDANYSGSAWTSLKLIPPPFPPPPPPPGSFLSGAKGASPACRADWPARDDTKVPPPPNMASYLISTLAMGGRKVSSRRRRGKRAERTLLRLPKVYSINPGSRNFLRIGLWLVWGGEITRPRAEDLFFSTFLLFRGSVCLGVFLIGFRADLFNEFWDRVCENGFLFFSSSSS